MDFACHKLFQTRISRSIMVLGMLACTVLVFHTLTLPSTIVSPPSFPTSKIAALQKKGTLTNDLSIGSSKVGEFSLLSDRENHETTIKEVVIEQASDDGEEGAEIDREKEMNDEQPNDKGNDSEIDDGSDMDEDGNPDTEFSFKLGDGYTLKKVRDPVGEFITLVKVKDSEDASLEEKVNVTIEGYGIASVLNKTDTTVLDDTGPVDFSTKSLKNYPPSSPLSISPMVTPYRSQLPQAVSSSSRSPIKVSNMSFFNKTLTSKNSHESNSPASWLSSLTNSSIDPSLADSFRMYMKNRRRKPPQSVADMNKILQKTRTSFRSMRPRWSSARDQQILAVKSLIDHPPIVKKDGELHASAFHNISMFKRSYELMERTLKVYVYKEGQKPIFHQPLLKGIYASEGWFMKLMEGNRRFVVRDPRKAHLFYIPFSSRFLEFSLYVPNSHKRTNLRAFLQNYIDTIAAKYPFWNRTGGTDHFAVACHDWASYETTHTMDRCIRALCNADLANNFRLGKDVSLPETYVRFGKDPLRDLGGKPAEKREIFAFYAGNMHGYLRSVLLQYWENKDPDMKIYGPMPRGVKSKMNYIQHMKNSKYCICPRGYEVNSPRVVEAIFYECVPVIISDNFVPAFFEVLNWEAFAVFVPEMDIPRLKEILTLIPEEKYLSLQMGVKRVQKHFLWHSKPVKYDLFHMILHSIWYNRVYTLKPR